MNKELEIIAKGLGERELHREDWQDSWTQWLKLYGKELAEKQGVYSPKEDEIEVIPVPDADSNIWTVHINVRKGKEIEIVQFDFTIKEFDSKPLDIAK